MDESIGQLLARYVRERTYSFQDFVELSVNSVGREMESPLHMACTRGAYDDVCVLLAAGADVNAKTDIGSTPLHRAVYSEQIEIVRILLAHGADSKAADNYSETPLSKAQKSNLEAIAAILASAVADP
jgi:uncharacterized protein